ncbi:cubilin-like [Ptychodera flava]|uniref:cubilin-like n=1 Tax=Ptychodera flava TaxID=63121 RepID=UPI00396A4195
MAKAKICFKMLLFICCLLFRFSTEAACGGDIKTKGGTVSSPFYPDSYLKGGECTWTIGTYQGTVFSSNFDHFELRYSEDSVQIRNDESDGEPGIGRYTNDNPPGTVNDTEENKMWISLKAHDLPEKNGTEPCGFRLMLNVIGGNGGDIYGQRGFILSPGNLKGSHRGIYPDKDAVYTWNIHCPNGSYVLGMFVDFSLSTFDKVSIFDGDESEPFIEYQGYQGQDEQFNTTGNKMVVQLFTIKDYAKGFGRFELNFEARLLSTTETVTGCSGTVVSPFYPLPYPMNVQYTTEISTPSGTIMNLEFTELMLRNGDNVSVYDQDGRLLAGYQSEKDLEMLETYSNVTYVILYSGLEDKTRIGVYSIEFKGKADCGGEIVSEGEGSIEFNGSPGLDTNECIWTIYTIEHSRVTAKFETCNLKVETDGNYEASYIEIRDGENAEDRLMGNYTHCDCSSSESPISIGYASTNVMWIRLVSPTMTDGRLYFDLRFDACGGDIKTKGGTVSSPFYPDSYLKGGECTWTIVTYQGTVFSSSFDHFALRYSEDSLQIGNDESDGEPDIGRYTNDNPPGTVNDTEDNKMWINLKAHDLPENSGTEPCGFQLMLNARLLSTTESVTGCSGTVVSPFYPLPYPMNVQYTTEISTPPGTIMNLEFTELTLRNGDNVSVYDQDGRLLAGCQSEKNLEMLETYSNVTYVILYSGREDNTRIGVYSIQFKAKYFILRWRIISLSRAFDNYPAVFINGVD